MPIVARIDEYGRGAWIALMILGFVVWWPLGLAILAFSIGSRRMGGRHCEGRWEHKIARMQEKMERLRGRMERGGEHGQQRWGGERGQWWGGPPTSGNRAFDEYRTETLKRLEEEQREFREFLDRLRFAKDKTEFDQFMADRRSRPSERPSEPPPVQPQA